MTDGMLSKLEFHDSEVSLVEPRPTGFFIRFSAAYIHQPGDATGHDATRGYAQGVELTLQPHVVERLEAGCVGRISEGHVLIDGRLSATVPFPFEAVGDITLDLGFTNGSRCRVHATGIMVNPSETTRVVASYRC